jgi:cob(I)alamin adenosyltransferase
MNKLKDGITKAEALAEELHSLLGRLVKVAEDYDINRVLKRSEAELMDLRHNLSLVQRLLQESE